MISLKKLTSQNLDEFKKVYSQSKLSENYDRDFFKLYDEQNFVVKFIFKRFLKLFTYNNDIIGFMWYETPMDINIRIWALYIDNRYLSLLNENLLKSFNNSLLSYEAVDSNRNIETLQNLGFKMVRPTVFMKLQISNYNKDSYLLKYENGKDNTSKIITFRTFKIGEDEEIRCKIQNDIFSDYSRIPLTIEDVYSDLNQDYYINDLAIFMEVNNVIIGYGQIVFNRDIYTVVNFGIIAAYRGRGYGRLLLNKLIILSTAKAMQHLYIRVDKNNTKARELYKWAGFEEKYMISKWER
ncbi:GNAT family N-acetyltransferase [Clostridium gasigenes]|uniref:GNAT family N-acetyltransferase n=1 Tax=Clostridium gasigenes TaxID=94869 RepID=A0A7X0VU18_9CLOT|nr:GNAT family N-acetyltransferase [Clostridium gasigenes]MBB6716011.1 GNAT family N-acetyltransferase [Clostridium gasigenes]MBU3106693.1 GNAT family N-acetyltransferase [Clostridium gasigenes]